MDDSEDQNCIRKSDIVKSVIGSGPHRKIVLASLLKEKRLIRYVGNIYLASLFYR